MHRCHKIHRAHENVRRFAVVLALSCCAQTAIAQAPTEARLAADALFEQGKAALLDGDWTTGCDLFRQSQQLDSSASTLIKLARCHEHESEFKAALLDYDQALALIRLRPENDDHASKLMALAVAARDELKPRLGTLKLRLLPRPEQFRLEIDGEALDPAAAFSPIMLDPGSHRITVTAPEYHSAPHELTLAEGELRQLTLELWANRTRPAPPAPPTKGTTAPPTPRPKPAPNGPGLDRQVLAVSSAAAGGILLGVGGYYAVRTRSLVRDARTSEHCNGNYECDPQGIKLLEQAGTAQTTAIVFGSAGAVLAGLGLVLWATAPSGVGPAERPHTALQVGPMSVLLRGRW